MAHNCYYAAALASPAWAEAWYMAGGMYVVVGQSEPAMPFFNRALAADPTHSHTVRPSPQRVLNRKEAPKPAAARHSHMWPSHLASPTLPNVPLLFTAL